MDRLIRRLSSCFAYDLNRYDVMRTQPQECTRRTHAVSCGWTNVHDMMHNESYIRTQRTSTSKLLHAPCSYKHWAATASLLLGIFFGFILIHQLNSMKIGWLQSVIAAGSIWLQKQWKTMNKHRAPFSPFKSFKARNGVDLHSGTVVVSVHFHCHCQQSTCPGRWWGPYPIHVYGLDGGEADRPGSIDLKHLSWIIMHAIAWERYVGRSQNRGAPFFPNSASYWGLQP